MSLNATICRDPKTSEVVGQRGKENNQSKFVKLQMPEKEIGLGAKL